MEKHLPQAAGRALWGSGASGAKSRNGWPRSRWTSIISRSEKDTPGWTYHADPVSLAGTVDYLVVALVGGKETKKFVSADVIAAMDPRGVLINISRGTTVDEAAILESLENGEIAGAGLDVFLGEPNIAPRFNAFEKGFNRT